MRVPMMLLALVLTPVVAVSAQGRSEACNPKPANRGTAQSAGARAAAPGQAKKACDVVPTSPPPPAPVPPPPTTETAEIHGTVFGDVDVNFVLTSGEVGLAGWTIELSGPVSGTFVTGTDGTYSFTGLLPGTYVICEVPQMSFWQSMPMDGVVCGSGNIGYTRVVSPDAPGVRFLGNDFGNVPIQ